VTDYPEGQWRQPVSWVVNHSDSAFVPLIRERMKTTGADPEAPVFAHGGRMFAVVELPGYTPLTVAVTERPPFGRRSAARTRELVDAIRCEEDVAAAVRALLKTVGPEQGPDRARLALERALQGEAA
jgi:hypothetical protein